MAYGRGSASERSANARGGALWMHGGSPYESGSRANDPVDKYGEQTEQFSRDRLAGPGARRRMGIRNRINQSTNGFLGTRPVTIPKEQSNRGTALMPGEERRRSQRVIIRVPVTLVVTENGQTLRIAAHTVAVNIH